MEITTACGMPDGTDFRMSDTTDPLAPHKTTSRRSKLAACAAIFLVALGVRLLHWQDNRHAPPFEGMGLEYKAHGLMLVEGDLRGFLRGPDPPSNANVVKHPPGYPILTAVVYKTFGDSDAALRFLHIALDAAAALLVFFLAAELLPFGAAVVAGLLVAVSPQLAYHSIALVPDPLATPPILLAFYFLVRAWKRPRLGSIIAAGACVGLSCWLRSNALLLPFFMAALTPLLFERGRRRRYAAALVGAALLTIAPITVRNLVAFKSFIPLSLSAGITLVEGIGVYDEEGRFGLPYTDYGVTKWEAERDGRPDYLGTRFCPDGVERERRRVAAGLAVVREDPLWFLGVMAHRGTSMFRLARVEVVAPVPAATSSLPDADGARPAPESTGGKARAGCVAEGPLLLPPPPVGESLTFEGDNPAELIVGPPLAVDKHTDYLLRLPLKIERGGLVLDVVDAQSNAVLASTPVLHPVNWLELPPGAQPFVTVRRPFVSGEAEQVKFVLRNSKASPLRVAAEAGRAELSAL